MEPPRHSGSSSVSADDGSSHLRRRGWHTSSWRRTVVFPDDTDDGITDDGFDAAREAPSDSHSANLQNLQRFPSMAADRSHRLLQQKPPPPSRHSMRFRSTLSAASRMEKVRAQVKQWTQEFEANAGEQSALSDDHSYSSSLAVAHMSSVLLGILYEQALSSHGFSDEEAEMASLLEGIREAEQTEAIARLQGFNWLLKDGLLELFLRMQPYLPPVPSQIVKFRSLEYTITKLVAVDDSHETNLTRASKFRRPFTKKKMRPERVRLLKDVTGYLMPGTLTLVLGLPSSGKSSLLNVLSGNRYPGSSLEGRITYNKKEIHDIPDFHLSAVMGQPNNHLPFLTIRETLAFARECLLALKLKDYGPELKEILDEFLRRGQDPKLELNTSMMGLTDVAHRIVGNAFIPSITENERQRVTAAEMFSGAHAVYFYDQPHTVPEDTIAFNLLTALRIFTRARQITFVASIRQPSLEVFDMFDRVILMNEGHIVYQGPRQDAVPYFESLGYKKPNYLGIAEFLQEVTTSDGTAYFQHPNSTALTLDGFVKAYKSSNMYKDICRIVDGPELVQELWGQGIPPNAKIDDGAELSGVCEMDGIMVNIAMDQTTSFRNGDKIIAFGSRNGALEYIKTSDSFLSSSTVKNPESVRLQLERPFKEVIGSPLDTSSKAYVLGVREEVALLIKREFKNTWRDKVSLQLRLLQVLVLSLFVGFLLFRVQNDADQKNMSLYRTAFFVSVMNMTMFNLGQLPVLMSERSVYYKQKRAHFYRPVSFLIGKFVGSLPFSLCEGTIWTILVYFLTGMSLADGGWHFFVYYVVIILTVLNGASMVRFMSFLARDMEKAGGLIGLLAALFILFAGFLLPSTEVPKYWIWMYYLDPIQWAITALMLNEFNSGSYKLLCKDANLSKIYQCVGRMDQTIGHAFLARGKFHTDNFWIIVAIIILFAWLVLWNLLTYWALIKIQHIKITKPGSSAKPESKINAESVHIEDIELARKELSQISKPVTLSWHELSYDVMTPGMSKPRKVLSSVSGWGEPTDMVALLGCEEEGKSALLNCLAGRKVNCKHIGGQILVNGFPREQKSVRHVIGHVEQIDAYAPYLTVRETVALSASMRHGAPTRQEQERFVEEVLELIQLKHIENRLLTTLTNDVGFDQEQHVAIATELAANPSVLFLENPTKGLDSSSATRIMSCLQQIAMTGRLVIVTMHHSSQRILSMFTLVQILKANGGETVYFGPVGKNCETIRTYFEMIPGAPLCPHDKTVSAYVLDITGDVAYKKSKKDYAFQYRVSELFLRNHVYLRYIRRSKAQNGEKIQIRSYGAPFFTMLYDTILSMQREYWRNSTHSSGRMVMFVIMGLLLGSVFYKRDLSTSLGMNARAGAILISCLFIGLSSSQNAVAHVMQLRAVFLRERIIHQLNMLFYNMSFILAEVPYLTVASFLFCVIFLPMTDIAMQSVSVFMNYWFLSLEFYIVITFFGLLVAVASPTPKVASVVIPIITGIWVSTSGLVVTRSKINKEFIWIFWINPLQYALDGLSSLAFFCDLEQPSCRGAACATQPSTCPSCDCPRLRDFNGAFVWTQMSTARSLDRSRVSHDMIALALFAVVFRLLSLLAFKFMKHNKRA